MSLLACTRDDALKIIDLRQNQVTATIGYVFFSKIMKIDKIKSKKEKDVIFATVLQMSSNLVQLLLNNLGIC